MRMLLLGFGNTGRALAQVLASRTRQPGLAVLEPSIVGVVTRRHGALALPDGIDPASLLKLWNEHGGFLPETPGFAPLDAITAASTLDYDVLVELTTLAVADRGEPAISHVRAALARGRHVVTANKGPIAWAWRELSQLARANAALLLCEATVMDGAPVFNVARTCLRGDDILRIEGILNSTTNLVLESMERGASLRDAVAEAQAIGVAEADPNLDLDGWDAAAKIAALANVLLGGSLTPDDVRRESVADLDPALVRDARSRGRRIKVVAVAARDGDGVSGRVEIREVRLDDPLATVAGTGSLLRLTTAILGSIDIAVNNPDLASTAFGVVADLIDVAYRLRG